MEIMVRNFVWLVCLLTFLLCQTRLTEAQANRYGEPPNCLLSRVEEFPCTPRFPQRTDFPNSNFFGNYSTRMARGTSGRPVCQIHVRNHRVRPIPILGNDERVKFIFSPGIRLDPPQHYGNQKYILYNISCPEGHLAFFNLTSINLEEPNCRRSRSGAPQLCRDYVQLIRPGEKTIEYCGSEITCREKMNQFAGRNFSILFRTSYSGRYAGFEATVICFRCEDADLPGCTRPGGGDELPTDLGRRRRDLNDFHRGWKRQLRHMRRGRRQSLEMRFERINVPHGVHVDYIDKTLHFITDDEGLHCREPIEDIIFMNTLDPNGNQILFWNEALNSTFKGPGPLWVVGRYAYFDLFAIDSRFQYAMQCFRNSKEMVTMDNSSVAQGSSIDDNSNEMSEEDNNSDCPDPTNNIIPGVTLSPRCVQGRKRRQAPERESDMLDDSVILTAIENENACNPVLRTSARATIALVMRDDPDRLRRLRDSATTTG